MIRALESIIIKNLPVDKIKFDNLYNDLYVTVLVNNKLTENEKLYLAYEINSELMLNYKYLRRISSGSIASISIKDTEEKYNEEVEYNNYDGGIRYEI